jgi:predicted ATPase
MSSNAAVATETSARISSRARNPVVIVFEDAHWIDPTSLELLDRTVARLAAALG